MRPRVKTIRVRDATPALRTKIESFPNFHKTGSITGMRNRFYGQNALLVRFGSYIYNVSREIYNHYLAR